MENNCDVKNLSLQLYGKEVEITLAAGSPTALLYKVNIMKGTLIGRIWGEKLVNGRQEQNVIALNIRFGQMETEIPCGDIKDLKKS